jgi:hypothetical protein
MFGTRSRLLSTFFPQTVLDTAIVMSAVPRCSVVCET